MPPSPPPQHPKSPHPDPPLPPPPRIAPLGPPPPNRPSRSPPPPAHPCYYPPPHSPSLNPPPSDPPTVTAGCSSVNSKARETVSDKRRPSGACDKWSAAGEGDGNGDRGGMFARRMPPPPVGRTGECPGPRKGATNQTECHTGGPGQELPVQNNQLRQGIGTRDATRPLTCLPADSISAILCVIRVQPVLSLDNMPPFSFRLG